MILKNALRRKICSAAICAALLAWSGLSLAAETRPDQYRPGEFLGLDLSKAVLSPKPLGPPSTFAPVPIEADSGSPGAQARAEPKLAPGHPVHTTVVRQNQNRVAERPEKPRGHRVAERPERRGAARVKLARRHSNPLDAQAFDTRIQVWPCKTGGICNWQRP
jgi:hypothetical protein